MTEMTEVRRRLPEMLRRLRGFAYKLARNHADADDLIQDTCVKALSREHQYQEGTNLLNWLAKIMQTIWLDRVRHNTLATECHAWYPNLLTSEHVIPADTNAIIAEVEQRISELPLLERELVIRRTARSQTHSTAARELGICKTHACAYWQNGQRALAEFLEYA